MVTWPVLDGECSLCSRVQIIIDIGGNFQCVDIYI